jgi:TPR repeat protein
LPKDELTGLRVIRSSAEKGFPPAMVFMGNALFDGRGMPPDKREGLTLYGKQQQQEA